MDDSEFVNPDATALCDELSQVHVVAVVGLSPNADRPSYRIARALQSRGFRIVPVRPLVTEVLGERAYAKLADVPFPVDLVNVFRSADAVDGIVDDCIATGARRLWIQEGIINVSAARRAVAHGIWTVMDRCVWRDLKNLCVDRTPRQEVPA
jgi:predicted CoA-binding protein